MSRSMRRECYCRMPTSAMERMRILLQKSKVASVRIFGETLKRVAINDSDNRRLQPLRYLHDCFDCFRLERLPGGVRTHWKL